MPPTGSREGYESDVVIIATCYDEIGRQGEDCGNAGVVQFAVLPLDLSFIEAVDGGVLQDAIVAPREHIRGIGAGEGEGPGLQVVVVDRSLVEYGFIAPQLAFRALAEADAAIR